MNIKNARSVSPEILEERRQQAVRLHQQGLNYTKIAEIVGAHRNTVGQWIAAWKSRGRKALKVGKRGRPKGSGRHLSPREERSIQSKIVDRHPEQLKLDFALWSRDAVRLLIKQECGIDMPIRTVGEYLKRWGFTPQKPVRRAYERCEASVQRWLDEIYPSIAQKARQDGAEIQWGDETGLRSDDVNGRGYAPQGKTPVRRAKGTPEKINMISSVTNQGKVRFMFYKGALNASVFITFLKRIVRGARGRKVFLIIDNLRVHHAKVVSKWVAEHSEEIALFYLPSYSPDLNPDEYLNNDLKNGVSKRAEGRKKGRLHSVALSQMRSIQKQPARVKKYFEAKPIQYAR
ncbi:MAG: IS630 family transposase [Candidatus Sumerlaeota bacterium]